jgi:hypothetical protein
MLGRWRIADAHSTPHRSGSPSRNREARCGGPRLGLSRPNYIRTGHAIFVAIVWRRSASVHGRRLIPSNNFGRFIHGAHDLKWGNCFALSCECVIAIFSKWASIRWERSLSSLTYNFRDTCGSHELARAPCCLCGEPTRCQSCQFTTICLRRMHAGIKLSRCHLAVGTGTICRVPLPLEGNTNGHATSGKEAS